MKKRMRIYIPSQGRKAAVHMTATIETIYVGSLDHNQLIKRIFLWFPLERWA